MLGRRRSRIVYEAAQLFLRRSMVRRVDQWKGRASCDGTAQTRLRIGDIYEAHTRCVNSELRELESPMEHKRAEEHQGWYDRVQSVFPNGGIRGGRVRIPKDAAPEPLPTEPLEH